MAAVASLSARKEREEGWEKVKLGTTGMGGYSELEGVASQYQPCARDPLSASSSRAIAEEHLRRTIPSFVRTATFDPITCTFTGGQGADIETNSPPTQRCGKKNFQAGHQAGEMQKLISGSIQLHNAAPIAKHKHSDEFTRYPGDTNMEKIIYQQEVTSDSERAMQYAAFRNAKELEVLRGGSGMDPIRWINSATGSPAPISVSPCRTRHQQRREQEETAAALISYSAATDLAPHQKIHPSKRMGPEEKTQVAELIAPPPCIAPSHSSPTADSSSSVLSPCRTPLGYLMADSTEDALNPLIEAMLSPIPSGRRRHQQQAEYAAVKDLLVPISRGERRILNARIGREMSRLEAFSL